MEEKKQLRTIRILIGIPSRGQFACDMALSLVHLINMLNSAPVIELNGERVLLTWYVHVIRSSMLYGSRQKLVDIAKDPENKIDYLLFLDDDMVFPNRLLHEWIMADRAVIAANCPTRGSPTYPTARNRSIADFRGKVVYSDVGLGRFQKVWRVGTGIMLLRQDALQALPRPAFTPRWVDELQDYCGEDWAMVEHLEKAGIDVYIDNEVSLAVGHVGDMQFTHDMVAATRRVEAKQKSEESGIIGISPNLHDSEAPTVEIVRV